MKIKDEIIGRDVLDGTGHKIGEVEDVDVDFDSERILGVLVHKGGILGGKDRIIPLGMIETIGERVILKKETSDKEYMEEDRDYEREEDNREDYVHERDLSGRSRDKPIIRDDER